MHPGLKEPLGPKEPFKECFLLYCVRNSSCKKMMKTDNAMKQKLQPQFWAKYPQELVVIGRYSIFIRIQYIISSIDILREFSFWALIYLKSILFFFQIRMFLGEHCLLLKKNHDMLVLNFPVMATA